jgi:hypothetical protein
MQKLVFAALAAMVGICAQADASRAAIMCGGVQPTTAVEFAPGSAALAPHAVRAQERAIRTAIGTSKLVGYRVLVMGDLREGAAMESASVQARLADQALARARGLTVMRMLRRLPAALRAPDITVRLLPNRRVAASVSGFNDRTGAIIEIGVWYRDAAGVYIAC